MIKKVWGVPGIAPTSSGGYVVSLPPPRLQHVTSSASIRLCFYGSESLSELKTTRLKKNEINKNTCIMHMATDLVNLKRVKSLPAQIEVTEKKKGLPVPVLSMLEFFFFFFFLVKGRKLSAGPWEK